MLKHLGFITALLALLSGCATTIPDPNQPLVKYTAIGRAALKSPDNNGQASFNWEQKSQDNVKLIVQGPLGSGRLDLIVSPTESVLKTESKTYKDASPDVLFAEIAGFSWPISGMKSWIVGKPYLEHTLTKKDKDNRIASFYEDGWTIKYKKWRKYKQREVPEIIEITRNDIRLRLLVEHWRY